MPGEIRRMPGGRCTAIEGAMSPLAAATGLDSECALGTCRHHGMLGLDRAKNKAEPR